MENIDQSLFYPDYSGSFGDSRLEIRGKNLWNNLSSHPCSSVRKLSETLAEQKAYYRFLDNEKVEEKQLIKECSQRMSKLAKGRHLLCIQDTCEVNLSGYKERLKPNSGIGLSDKIKNPRGKPRGILINFNILYL